MRGKKNSLDLLINPQSPGCHVKWSNRVSDLTVLCHLIKNFSFVSAIGIKRCYFAFVFFTFHCLLTRDFKFVKIT